MAASSKADSIGTPKPSRSTVPERLLAVVHRETLGLRPRGFCVAFSGGVDSTALLVALAQLGEKTLTAPVRAAHVNHGLDPSAENWAQQCVQTAAAWGIHCLDLRVDLDDSAGKGVEAAAREARYEALGRALFPGEVLLTAHHLNDQAETVFLQLIRGAGVAGLAAMPALQQFGGGWHLRPMLEFAREDIEAFAREQGLRWIEDSSNFDARYDRSYLRHEILPRLRTRWPALDRTVARAARHCAQATSILDYCGQIALADSVGADSLSIEHLQALDTARRLNLLRYWIKSRALPLPATIQLEEAERHLLTARQDAEPLVAWPGAELRRFRDRIYAMKPLTAASPRSGLWHPGERLKLGEGLGSLRAVEAVGAGIRADLMEKPIEVRFRIGGERLKPAGSVHTRPLKKLFHEQGVLPWMRDKIPLLFKDRDLVAVGDIWIAGESAALAGQAGYRIVWDERPKLL